MRSACSVVDFNDLVVSAKSIDRCGRRELHSSPELRTLTEIRLPLWPPTVDRFIPVRILTDDGGRHDESPFENLGRARPVGRRCRPHLLRSALAPRRRRAPRFKFDPDWPKPLPNKWKMGGVTGLAVDKDDNIWVLNRPNDLVSIEVHAEQDPPLADCCVARAGDDSLRQGRQRDRIVRRAAGAWHGGRQTGVHLYRAEHRPQVRPEDRQVAGGHPPHP